MSSSIPLIRAAAVIPGEQWLTQNQLPAAELLMAAGLPASPSAAPARLVSVHGMMLFLENMAAAHGPDFGARIATPEALLCVGTPARAIRQSRTVGEALHRIASTFHQHASQLFLHIHEGPGGMQVKEGFSVIGSATMHHQAQQHFAATMRCIGYLANGRPLDAELAIIPHPEFGIDHLKPYLGDKIVAQEGRQLCMWLPNEALALSFPWEPDIAQRHESELLTSAASHSLLDSARILIAGMIADGNPSLEQLALCSGRSRRTLQRLLAAEGTSFTRLLDSVRQDHVLRHLTESHDSVSSIGSEVGFRNISSVTRAVRRWTNVSPRQLRRDQQHV
ncbi:MAG: helix-turn-helix domain-containing protein [Polymorphobacter sp.]|uniref:AraC family transcriptional regulator n=1 Tax=Polymorphobacter sp. TaxID=1909290 RepID=UPI003A8A3291